jgi:hypothetical protein
LSKRASYIILVLGTLFVSAIVALLMPTQMEAFPDLELSAPVTRLGSEHLGLKPGLETFHLSEINADYVIIEAVNTMCQYCRDSARNVDILFKSLSPQATSANLKAFALFFQDSEDAVQNSVRYFPGAHPRIADPMGKLAQTGKVVVPTLYVIRLSRDGEPHALLYKHRGRLDDPGAMRRTILSRLGSNRFDEIWSLATAWWNE